MRGDCHRTAHDQGSRGPRSHDRQYDVALALPLPCGGQMGSVQPVKRKRFENVDDLRTRTRRGLPRVKVGSANPRPSRASPVCGGRGRQFKLAMHRNAMTGA